MSSELDKIWVPGGSFPGGETARPWIWPLTSI